MATTCAAAMCEGAGGPMRSRPPSCTRVSKATSRCTTSRSTLRHTAASLAIQAGAHIKSLQNMLGHASASLTLDRYGHLYESDVEAVGVAVNALLTSGFPPESGAKSGQIVGTEPPDGSE